MSKFINIKHILILFVVGLFCDAIFMGCITRTLLPEYAYSGTPYLYKISAIYRYLYNNIPIVYTLFSIIYIILFKLYLFPKTIILIEKENSEISYIIKNIHIRKNLLIGVILFLTICSWGLTTVISTFLYTNNHLGFIFSLPFQYIAIYFIWLYKDKLNQNCETENNYINPLNASIINVCKYVFVTNGLTFIVGTFICMLIFDSLTFFFLTILIFITYLIYLTKNIYILLKNFTKIIHNK